MKFLCFYLPITSYFLVLCHGPVPATCPRPNLVPVFGPGPGLVIFLVLALAPVPFLVNFVGPVTQWKQSS